MEKYAGTRTRLATPTEPVADTGRGNRPRKPHHPGVELVGRTMRSSSTLVKDGGRPWRKPTEFAPHQTGFW